MLASENDRVITQPAATWTDLGRVFNLRHILCHELASELEINGEEMRSLLLNAQSFIQASRLWLDKQQDPNRPSTPGHRMKTAKEAMRSTKIRLRELANESHLSKEAQQLIFEAARRLDEMHAAKIKAEAALNSHPFFSDSATQILEHAQDLNQLCERILRTEAYI